MAMGMHLAELAHRSSYFGNAIEYDLRIVPHTNQSFDLSSNVF